MVAAQETTLQNLLEGTTQYHVPLYQRPYQWGTTQLKQLWDDVEELTDAIKEGESASHFIGSLVLAPAPSGIAGGITPWLVVDGQQRLTTLSLLLAAIRDHIRSLDSDEELSREIHELYLVNRFKKGPEHIKLVPTQADRDSYNAIINQLPGAGGDDAVGKAYRFFKGKIAAIDIPEEPGDVAALKVAVTEGLDLVSISTDPRDNVHRIFQSLNNTGLKLTQGDLLRNYIFMRLPKTGEQAYERYWLPLQQTLNNDEIENLFWIDLAEKYPTAKISDTYSRQQQRLDKLKTEDEIRDDLDRLLNLAKLYRIILHPEFEENDSVRHRLVRLLQWGSSTPHPLVLRLLRSRAEGFTTDTELESALHVIESYLVRRFLIGKPTQGLNRNFRAIVASITGADPVDVQVKRWLSTGRRHFVNDEDLRDGIRNNPYYRTGRIATRKVFLEWLEQEHRSKEPVDTSSLTIEHVMPQTLSSEWRANLEAKYSPEEVEAIHQQMLHTLGNLTLTGYNASLSNRGFGWKRQELTRSGLMMNMAIADEEEWGAEEIIRRADEITDLVIRAWPGPMTGTVLAAEIAPQWIKLRQIVAALPAGHWTAYGDLAVAVGTGAQAVGNYLAANVTANPHRVLRASGKVSANFEWSEEQDNRDPETMLKSEGVRFNDAGRAAPEQRLSSEQLLDLLEELDAETAQGEAEHSE